MAINIWYGSNENAHLSNLAYRPFEDKNGTPYRSVEHAYQTWRGGYFDASTYERGKWRAKTNGPKPKTVGNWHVHLLEKLIRRSFAANPEAAKTLLATGEEELTHNQDWGIWKYEFPRIMTEVRNELRG